VFSLDFGWGFSLSVWAVYIQNFGYIVTAEKSIYINKFRIKECSMKNFLVCVFAVMFFIMMPFLSFAKESIPDNELGSLTAQEGVTIDFGTFNPANPFPFPPYNGQAGNILVQGFAPALQSWGDGDGFNGFTNSGWIGAFTTMAVSDIFVGGKMTIDVGTNASNITAVKIGLPSALVLTEVTDTILKLGTGKQLSDSQPALGTIYNDVFAAIINPTMAGNVVISNHGATNSEGIEIAFNGVMVAIPGSPMTSSWGDNDGYSGMTGAGFFGTKGMTVADGGGNLMVIINGTMSIDVGTDAGGNTGVNIVLPTTTITTSGITQPLVLATSKDLNTNAQTLGTSYMGNLTATVAGGLTITAH
jgi:hypothetical protein